MSPGPKDDREPTWTVLEREREICRNRYDRVHAEGYDARWDRVLPTHADYVGLLVAAPPGPRILDAACGTGKYFPQLSAAGCQVTGIDQSEEMLARARAKHPDIPVRRMALQELGLVPEFAHGFDGLMCVDAMLYVGAEHWPWVLSGFRAVLRASTHVYLTVRRGEKTREADLGRPASRSYRFSPSREQVHRWLTDAHFSVQFESVANRYLHILARAS